MKLKFWKVFLVFFFALYLFGVILRILGTLFNNRLEMQPFKGVDWLQVFLFGELDGTTELITPRWWVRVASIIILPLIFAGLISHKKIKLS